MMFAFLFSKIGAWIVGAVVVAALVGGGYWYIKHLQGQVTDLKDEVASLTARAEVIEKAQAATDEFMKKKTAVQVRVVREKANVDKVVEAGDDAGMRQLYLDRGLLGPKASPPASGTPGRPGNISPRAPRLQPLN